MAVLPESDQTARDTPERSDRLESVKTGTEFPEGGTRAWLVLLGAFCVSFATFGYMNAFG